MTTDRAEGKYRPIQPRSASESRTVYSQAATFTQGAPPSITVQPVSRTVCSANGIQFSVKADGTDLRYTWQYYDSVGSTWITLVGFETNTLTISDNFTPSNEQFQVQYQVIVSNGYGSVTSQPVTLTKLPTAFITQQPIDQIACSSKGLQYSVQVKQEENLSYYWEFNDGRGWASLLADTNVYKGYNTGALTIKIDEPTGRQYRAKINNRYCTIYSDSVAFTKLRAIVITRQPISQTVCSGNGKGLTYSVQADGDDLAYEWEFKDPNMSEWKSFSDFADTYPDYTTATLTANGVETPGRQYRVKIINDCGTIHSDSATFALPTQAITQQPVSRTACSASNNGLQYTVVVESTGQVTYEWEFKDPNTSNWVSLGGRYAPLYPGYDTPTLTTNGNEANGRQYQVKITNSCGTMLYSQLATFALAANPPVITQQPGSRSACTTRQNGLQYTVVVESTGQVTYDWEFKDPDMDTWKSLSGFAELYPGYSTATLTTNGVETPGRQYRVKINNGCAYSQPATFTLVPTPTITQQPISRTACLGNGLTYEVKADGSGSPLTYDWEFSDNNGGSWASLSGYASAYPGYNTATLTTNGTESNGRQYRVKITNGVCMVNSGAATFTRSPGPTISTQPISRTACSGKGLTYSVQTNGMGLTYDWEYKDGGGWASLSFDGRVYPGYNTATLTTNGDEPNGRKYRVKITSSCDPIYSDSATFTQALLPTISTQPISRTACSGKGLQYAVKAEGTALTYDWEFNDGGNWTSLSAYASAYPGYNTATLTTNGDESNGRQYRVTITNSCGPVHSQPATFTQSQCTPTLTNVSASPKSVVLGQSIEFTATVGGTTGSYNYTLTNGAGSSQTGTASGSSFSQRLIAQGTGLQTYTLTIGDSPYSVTGTVSITVGSFTITGLTAYANPVKAGRSVEFTATFEGLTEADLYSYTLTNGHEPTPLTGDFHGSLFRESITAQGSGVQLYTLTVIARNKGTATATVSVTVIGEDVGQERFAISGVKAVGCETLSENQRQIRFTPQYVGINGEPIGFSVVNELLPTTQPGPYSLRLYTDNLTITLVARQGNDEARYSYNWLANCPATSPSSFTLTGARLVDCQLEDASSSKRYKVSLQPQYVGQNNVQPISFSVVNELSPTTVPGPYTLYLWGDNPTITMVARQGNAEANYTYNWLAGCKTTSGARLATVEEIGAGMQVRLLGNPVTDHQLSVEINGVEGQSVDLTLTDLTGRQLTSERIERSARVEQRNLRISPAWGRVLLLRVRAGSHQQTMKVIQGQ